MYNQKQINMKEEQLELDGLIVTFEYDKRFAEPVVGYMIDYWFWEVLSVEVASDLLYDSYDILDKLSVKDFGKIDDEIEEYLNNK